MTISRFKFLTDVAENSPFTPQYAEDILVRIAHHSAAIEGNTLTVSDTITLLIDDLTPSAGRPMKDLYEVANHREALATVITHAFGTDKLSTGFIRLVHQELLDHIMEDRGKWKSTGNAILGAKIDTAPPEKVPWLMEQWAENASWQADNIQPEYFARAVADAHADFEQIHPFADGNGRTGRMLLMWQSLRATGIPIIIEVEQRERYIKALRDNDRDDLAALVAQQWAVERDRAASFGVQIGES